MYQVIVLTLYTIHTYNKCTTVSPTILALHQLVTVRIGETVTLKCNASGVPPPAIHWYKSVGTVPGEMSCSGSCYTIPHVDMSAGGDYICSASNGVGQPQHANIRVKILCEC